MSDELENLVLEELFQAAPEGVVLLDNHDRVLRCNPEFIRMFGYTQAEASGRPVNELLAPESLRASSLELTERVARGETVNVETVRRTKDGRLIDVSILGYPVRGSGSQMAVYGIYRDITARKRAERSLAERERYFRSLIESTSNLIAVTDRASEILYAAAGSPPVLGDDGSMLHGQRLFDRVHEEDVDRVAAELATLLDSGRPLQSEARFLHADGTWRVCSVLIRNLLDDAAVHGLVVSLRDLSGERAREAQLRRVERLATLGTLIGGVAHELNNPLTAIRGFADLMLMTEHPDADREALETISREATRAARIVANLRLVARRTQEPAYHGPVDLNDVIGHVLRLRRYALETRNIEVVEHLTPDLPPALGDRGQIEQVVLNLIINAEQALAARSERRGIELRTLATGDAVALHVVDNGAGIPADIRERIFDPFFTTKPPGEGTGLGLSMVDNIVTEHGGIIRVDSTPGEGAAFIIELPAAEPAPEPVESTADAPPARVIRVLIVDDEPAIRHSLSRFLSRRGHIVETAGDGAEALVMLDAAEHDPFDVIVSDLRMPGVSGDQLLALLRERGKGLEHRLVFMTGDVGAPDTARILANANVPVLLKPFELADLARVIEERAERPPNGDVRAVLR